MATEPSTAEVKARHGVLRAVITRADGTVEDAGIVSASYASPIRQLWWVLVGRPAANRRIRRINRAHAARQTAGGR